MPLATKTPEKKRPADKPPPLQAGDRLTVEEFERRYEAMPELKKAELIKGVVYMPSPVSTDDHAVPHFDMIGWLAFYKAFTVGVEGGDNATLRMLLGNRPQPDVFLRILPAFGGQSRTVDKYVVGSPELVGEVSASSASYDLHDKLDVFREQGVLEYVVWRVWDKAIDWFFLHQGQYQRLPLTGELYQSRVFPGLWLNPDHLLQRDLGKILQVIQQGVATVEHAAFCQRLLLASQQSKKG